MTVKGDPVAQARRHGALIVVEEVRSLRAETEKVAVRVRSFVRLLSEGAAERLFGEEEMGEVGRHEKNIA